MITKRAAFQILLAKFAAVFIDHFQGIDDVAQGFGHLAPLGIAHQAVVQHRVERGLAHLLNAREDHARHPEEDDIIAGHQHRGRVVIGQIFGLFGPAQGGEGPERRGEPGIQRILVLI